MKKFILISLIICFSFPVFAKGGFSYGKSGGKSFNILGMNFGSTGKYTIAGKSAAPKSIKQSIPKTHAKLLKKLHGAPREAIGNGEMTLY